METLESERFVLRPFVEEDCSDMFEYAQNPIVGPMAGWKPHDSIDESLKIIRMFIENDRDWAIVDKITNKVIGSLGLYNDRKRDYEDAKMIGYALSENYWGKGIVPEAVKMVLKFAFEKLDTVLVSVSHFPFNKQSKRVIEKCGFTYEGILRKSFTRFDGMHLDEVCYSITKDEYDALYKPF